MKAALATYKDGKFPPGAANTGGSQRPARSPECAPSHPNLTFGARKTPRDHVTLLHCGRMLKCVCGLTKTLRWRPVQQVYLSSLEWSFHL